MQDRVVPLTTIAGIMKLVNRNMLKRKANQQSLYSKRDSEQEIKTGQEHQRGFDQAKEVMQFYPKKRGELLSPTSIPLFYSSFTYRIGFIRRCHLINFNISFTP